jgi:hypothetical protein
MSVPAESTMMSRRPCCEATALMARSTPAWSVTFTACVLQVTPSASRPCAPAAHARALSVAARARARWPLAPWPRRAVVPHPCRRERPRRPRGPAVRAQHERSDGHFAAGGRRPARTRRRAIASPSPRAPPVTMATSPWWGRDAARCAEHVRLSALVAWAGVGRDRSSGRITRSDSWAGGAQHAQCARESACVRDAQGRTDQGPAGLPLGSVARSPFLLSGKPNTLTRAPGQTQSREMAEQDVSSDALRDEIARMRSELQMLRAASLARASSAPGDADADAAWQDLWPSGEVRGRAARSVRRGSRPCAWAAGRSQGAPHAAARHRPALRRRCPVARGRRGRAGGRSVRMDH